MRPRPNTRVTKGKVRVPPRLLQKYALRPWDSRVAGKYCYCPAPSSSSSLHERPSRDAAAFTTALTIRAWSRRTVHQTFFLSRECQSGVRPGVDTSRWSATRQRRADRGFVGRQLVGHSDDDDRRSLRGQAGARDGEPSGQASLPGRCYPRPGPRRHVRPRLTSWSSWGRPRWSGYRRQ